MAVDRLGWRSVALAAGAGFVALLYVVHARRTARPVLDLHHIAVQPYSGLALVPTLMLGAAFAANIYMPVYVSAGRGVSTGAAAWSVLFFTVGWTVGANVSSRLLDRRGAVDVMTLGWVVGLAGSTTVAVALTADASLAVASRWPVRHRRRHRSDDERLPVHAARGDRFGGHRSGQRGESVLPQPGILARCGGRRGCGVVRRRARDRLGRTRPRRTGGRGSRHRADGLGRGARRVRDPVDRGAGDDVARAVAPRASPVPRAFGWGCPTSHRRWHRVYGDADPRRGSTEGDAS